MCGTLVHIYIYISLYSVFCRLLWFVPMPCSLVLVVLSCITLCTSLLCPSRILFLDAYMFCALVECWTCKWYFAFKLISLYVRMFGCSFHMWMNIVVVIAYMVKPWFIALFHFAWSHCACFIYITSFSTYNDQIVLLCFRRYLFLWFKSFTDSRVRCEWVLFDYFQLTC